MIRENHVEYQVVRAPDGRIRSVLRMSDGASIPLAPGNRDFDAFAEWAHINAMDVSEYPPDAAEIIRAIARQINDKDAKGK